MGTKVKTKPVTEDNEDNVETRPMDIISDILSTERATSAIMDANMEGKKLYCCRPVNGWKWRGVNTSDVFSFIVCGDSNDAEMLAILYSKSLDKKDYKEVTIDEAIAIVKKASVPI